ncbi:hypothetical protein Nepgr_031903 [Nepenthes gracilis]|uniref:Cyclin-D-binding Myb-like transcription factor 1 n=1 Tax=Nepenthes gracilis TaxID=150966 RepID=A0AAD3Y792_NEPGR|nr:hypothetical protein Nepgr_031903 [Nepenthes gracilis]
MKGKEEEKNKGDTGGVHEDDVHSINHRESRKKGNGNERKIVKSVRNHLENEESNGKGEEGKAVNLKKNQITITENEAENTKITEGKEISRHEGMGSKKRKKELVGNESSSFGAGYFHETQVDAEVMEKSELTETEKKLKKVRFSGSVEVYPISNSSTERGRTLEDRLIRGKRFSSEEDEMVRKAVLNYIEVHSLGDEGLKMVLNCKSHPEVRRCWKEIGASLPWRPYMSVYYRAHILFERGERRKWTPEELEFVQRFHEKHGAKWKTIAEELGKHRFHVKDAWCRIKLPNMKKGQWSQEEYQTLFDLVNADIWMKAFQVKKSKHGMLRDNISWEAISNKLSTRTTASCCVKWYDQLTSPMVAEGKWADTDDYHLLITLFNLDASCEEDVDWDSLLEHRPGDACRKRWSQMVRHICEHRNKLFAEQLSAKGQNMHGNGNGVPNSLFAKAVHHRIAFLEKLFQDTQDMLGNPDMTFQTP